MKKIKAKKTLAEKTPILQKFVEELFAEDNLRYMFVTSSQSVHRTVKSEKFSELFFSDYWKNLMNVMTEVMTVTNQNTINFKHRFLSSDHILQIKSLPKEKQQALNDAYQIVKYLCP